MSRSLVLADDHPPTRRGVRLSLERGGFEVCAEVSNADDAVAAVLSYRPDIALLDVNMPGGGIAAAARIAADAPETAIVMLTVSRDDADLLAALQAGAQGYLLKDTDPERLPLALDGVLAGEAALPRTLVAKVIRAYQGRQAHRRLPLMRARGIELTHRETQVLELLEQGLTTKQIALQIEVSPVTVRRHVSTLLKKLDVTSRKDAVELVREPQT